MRHESLFTLMFGSYVRLGTSTPQQTSSALLTSAPGPTTRPAEPSNVRRQDGSSDTCGFVTGSVPVKCSSARCGLMLVFGETDAHVGCCDGDGCVFQTTCIEDGVAFDTNSLACTGRSSLCATYTWPEYDAVSFRCATSRFTETVSATSYNPTGTETDSFASTVTGADSAAPSETGSPSETAAPDDSGSSGGLPVYDLATRQRIGAGVGSGGFALLLLGFFAIYGCWKRPRPRSRQLPLSPSQVDDLQILSPIDDSGKRATQSHVVGYARVPLNVT
ncbi:hypothetical protein EDB81DRAFT_488952 [Dactylonectria macrodidyma]|uniref:Uncharacterized protein n=1 Tax=Dactylonectria macrodidyma TaxID=307937 RepID=A0A9P9EW16_9HYPO|nr:hypothetical protein EDB81DRAFT_488952 [Dactylonectria macrodidyma]